jgi:DNA-binding NarL/FixJ family response regulator
MKVIRVISEIFFSAKVSETCRSLGVECLVAKSKERLEQLLVENPVALVIVDLGLSGGAGPALAGVAVSQVGHRNVYAFYSHIAVDLLSAAQQSGVTNTFTRSSFFETLPDILSQYIAENSARLSISRE